MRSGLGDVWFRNNLIILKYVYHLFPWCLTFKTGLLCISKYCTFILLHLLDF